ncbi:MAG TPA: sulfur oxidation c-type cytochrome SoxX [Pelomicrobium sp.]|nr:sulfur oxidation c-type cytochrome SoxX [Pelomicrobium sp.]
MTPTRKRWLGPAIAMGFLAISAAASAQTAKEPTGKDLAFNNRKGNCMACHSFPTLQETLSPTSKNYTAANIGPPLIAMKARFPDRAKLRQQIADPMRNNPETSMPPFGVHGILTDKEIDLITDFVHGL